MRQVAVRPTGVERSFDPGQFIVSKTDRKGVITYANQTFCDVARYTEAEVVGQPHNLIRHPDMPRCVFKLLWDTVEAGEEIFAYVVNLAADGAHYWVFAHVTPTRDRSGAVVGFHSNRRVPDPAAVPGGDRPLRHPAGRGAGHPPPGTASWPRPHCSPSAGGAGKTYDQFVWGITPRPNPTLPAGASNSAAGPPDPARRAPRQLTEPAAGPRRGDLEGGCRCSTPTRPRTPTPRPRGSPSISCSTSSTPTCGSPVPRSPRSKVGSTAGCLAAACRRLQAGAAVIDEGRDRMWQQDCQLRGAAQDRLRSPTSSRTPCWRSASRWPQPRSRWARPPAGVVTYARTRYVAPAGPVTRWPSCGPPRTTSVAPST